MAKTFLLKENFFDFEFKTALKNSTPKLFRCNIISKVESDFEYGNFNLFLNTNNEFMIPFKMSDVNINELWKFLESIVDMKSPLLFNMFNKGEEIFIYVEEVDSYDVRFCVLDTIELYKKERERKILKYSYVESRVDLDIIIKKRKLIKNFYEVLTNIFKDYENIAFFEPPNINFDFWIKDSIKIKKFLSID